MNIVWYQITLITKYIDGLMQERLQCISNGVAFFLPIYMTLTNGEEAI